MKAAISKLLLPTLLDIREPAIGSYDMEGCSHMRNAPFGLGLGMSRANIQIAENCGSRKEPLAPWKGRLEAASRYLWDKSAFGALSSYLLRAASTVAGSTLQALKGPLYRHHRRACSTFIASISYQVPGSRLDRAWPFTGPAGPSPPPKAKESEKKNRHRRNPLFNLLPSPLDRPLTALPRPLLSSATTLYPITNTNDVHIRVHLSKLQRRRNFK